MEILKEVDIIEDEELKQSLQQLGREVKKGEDYEKT
jgi:hypothetical protein